MINISNIYCLSQGFPGGSDSEESDPWVRKISWRREGQPTPVFLPGEFHGQRSLAEHSPPGLGVGVVHAGVTNTC